MSNNQLKEPVRVESVNGMLNVTLTLEEATLDLDGFSLRTRTFNGTLPGPTLVLSPGDVLNVKFVNLLEDQGIPYRHNELSAPDESNLHWHGLHVSGEAPSDDALLVIPPGETYEYTSVLPQNHHPGTHWYHPHRHGSTTLQLGGGAAGAILVRDDSSTTTTEANLRPLPSIYTTDTRQVLMLVQPLKPESMNRIADNSRDSLFQVQDGTLQASRMNQLLLVNGQLQPVVLAAANEWIRLRIIHAQWDRNLLDISIPGCQMELIAKDGIYLPTLPRSVSRAPILPAGRADIMVQCPQASTVYEIRHKNDNDSTVLATIQTNDVEDPSNNNNIADLPSHVTEFPEYLKDLRSVSVESSCSCPTSLGPRDNGGVNGFSFEYDHTVHFYELGQVLERHLEAENHPYHQHVYPFQLTSGFGTTSSNNNENGDRRDENDSVDTHYYQLGDWHDTMEWEGAIRFRPTVFASKIMLHCHRLDHEDRGMMGIERVADACQCGSVQEGRDDDGFLSTGAIVGIGVGLVVVLVGGGLMAWNKRRRASK